MSKQIKAQLLLKVAGREPIPVVTAVPTTLKAVKDNKMVGYCNTNEVGVIEDKNNKNRIIQAWNGWRTEEYEVIWSGDSPKGLTKSNLPDQKGLLMGDYNGGSATRQIMEHLELLNVDEQAGTPARAKSPSSKKVQSKKSGKD
jgi:hypothetical protein